MITIEYQSDITIKQALMVVMEVENEIGITPRCIGTDDNECAYYEEDAQLVIDNKMTETEYVNKHKFFNKPYPPYIETKE